MSAFKKVVHAAHQLRFAIGLVSPFTTLFAASCVVEPNVGVAQKAIVIQAPSSLCRLATSPTTERGAPAACCRCRLVDGAVCRCSSGLSAMLSGKDKTKIKHGSPHSHAGTFLGLPDENPPALTTTSHAAGGHASGAVSHQGAESTMLLVLRRAFWKIPSIASLFAIG